MFQFAILDLGYPEEITDLVNSCETPCDTTLGHPRLICFCLSRIIPNFHKQPHVWSWVAFPYLDHFIQSASSSN